MSSTLLTTDELTLETTSPWHAAWSQEDTSRGWTFLAGRDDEDEDEFFEDEDDDDDVFDDDDDDDVFEDDDDYDDDDDFDDDDDDDDLAGDDDEDF